MQQSFLCPRCNNVAFLGQRFCGFCDLAFLYSCDSCGSALIPGSLFCGMFAIFEVLNPYPQGSPEQACFLILISALLDVCDGAIARLTRSTSAFGLHFDSLSDLVAFGVAPALLAFDAFGETGHAEILDQADRGLHDRQHVPAVFQIHDE